MYAGSLIVPFDKLAAAFEKEHPDVDVVTEAHGSIQVLRHVTELGDRMDLVATADEQLIPPLMYDRDDPATGEPWANWYCSFATNRMVLAVSPKSPLAGELTSKTWYRRLTQPDVRFGLADPRFDAAGYRALMVLQLAEREYDDPYLLEDMLMGRFTAPDHRGAPGRHGRHRGAGDPRDQRRLQRRAPRRQHPAGRPARVRRPRLRLRVRERGPAARARVRAAAGLHRPRRSDVAARTTGPWTSSWTSAASPASGPSSRGDVIRYAFTIPANAPGP